MDPGNSSHYILLEKKNTSTVSNNGRLDIFCENSANKTLQNGEKWWYTLQRKDDTAEILSLWRSFDTDSIILWNKKKQKTFQGKNNFIW